MTIIDADDANYDQPKNMEILLCKIKTMKINIESPHIQLSHKLKHKIEEKLLHLPRLYDRITACDITVFRQKDDEQKGCFIEAKLLLPKDELFVREHAENFDKALYQMIRNLLRQVRKYKGRLEKSDCW